MKYIAVIIFYFFGWFISIPFSDFEATQQKSYGGRAMSGSTQHYQFKMLAKVSSEKLEFKRVWIGTQNVEFKAYTLSADNVSQSSFDRGDTIFIDVFIHSKPDKDGNLVENSTKSVSAPIEYQGEALLEYNYKGNLKYYSVKKIKKLPKVYYP